MDAYLGLAQSLKALRRKMEAVACYQALVQLQPGCARTHAALAGLYFELGQLENAIVQYQEALRLEPTFSEAFNDLGNALRGVRSSVPVPAAHPLYPCPHRIKPLFEAYLVMLLHLITVCLRSRVSSV